MLLCSGRSTIHFLVFFFKQKTAYEMRISDWSSDVCSSDLLCPAAKPLLPGARGSRLRHSCLPDALYGLLQGVSGTGGPLLHLPPRRHGLAEDLGLRRLGQAERSIQLVPAAIRRDGGDSEIGRASCRERVCQYG